MPTQQLIKLVSHFEGCVLSAYPDPGTHAEPWTIGYGSTILEGTKVRPGMKITLAQAQAQLSYDLDAFQAKVKSVVHITLTQYQLDAITAFAYNVGIGNLSSSTLLKVLNAGQFDQVPAQLLRWNKAAGKVMNGLTTRRTSEGYLFAHGSLNF